MKSHLIAIVAAVLLVGCGPSASERALFEAARKGNIEAVKQHLAAGADVNSTANGAFTDLYFAAGHKGVVELLIVTGAGLGKRTTSHSSKKTSIR